MARSKPPLFRDVPKVRPAMVAPPDAPRGQRPDNRGVRPEMTMPDPGPTMRSTRRPQPARPEMVAPPDAPRGPRPDNRGVRPAMTPPAEPMGPPAPRPDNSGVRPAMMPVSTIANRAMDWAGIRR